MDSTEPRRVHIVDDLWGAVLMLSALAFALLLELTRRNICDVYQLAFVLCAVCTFFIIGGIVDHHLTDEQLTLALYGSYLSSSLTTSYVYLPILYALGTSLLAFVQLSICSCQCCCQVSTANITHKHCFAIRIRANMSLYTTSFITLIGAVGARLNARLRESAINPNGGTVHWIMLRAPFFLAMAHIGSLLFVALKLFLQHADKAQVNSPRSAFSLNELSSATFAKFTPPPAPKKSKVPALHGFIEMNSSQIRSPTKSSAALALADALAARGGRLGSAPASSKNGVDRPDNNEGDVSSLISSDSESDNEVLQPSIGMGTSYAHRSVYSGYSSSPPASPTPSLGSSLSTSPITRARARLHRSGTSEWNDNENSIDRLGYYSDRPSTASTTSTASLHGLRHRATATKYSSMPGMPTNSASPLAPPHLIEQDIPSSSTYPWVSCIDPSSGSTYYYNSRTGESRWYLT